MPVEGDICCFESCFYGVSSGLLYAFSLINDLFKRGCLRSKNLFSCI